jgi:hypothetical protein
VTLGALTTTAVGTRTITATGAVSLGAVNVVGSGTRSVTGVATCALGQLRVTVVIPGALPTLRLHVSGREPTRRVGGREPRRLI